MTPPQAFRQPLTKLIAHLRVPLFRNGYALIASSLLTSGLGVVYWIIAARLYSPKVVGINSAVISALYLLVNFSHLNLTNALNRFLPSAGGRAGRLIMSAYGIAFGLAITASTVFVLGIERWSPDLALLKQTPLTAVWFVGAIGLWVLFVLQDSALTGLRSAVWIPIENLIFAVAKIVLLVIFARFVPQFGIFASWTAPLVVLIGLTNWLIFRRELPKREQGVDSEPAVSGNDIARYVAGDYAASVLWTSAVTVLPILVLNRLGAEQNAVYYLAYTLAYTLFLISENMGMSLIAEASADESQTEALLQKSFVQSARLVLPAVGVILVGAPLILALFGESYSRGGAMLLRLLALAAVPYLVIAVRVSELRIRRETGRLIVVFGVMAVLLLGGALVLMPSYGVVGLGWAWLLSQTVLAFGFIFMRYFFEDTDVQLPT